MSLASLFDPPRLPPPVELLTSALAHLSDGVVITDASSRIVWANEAYCLLVGRPFEQLCGQTPRIARGSSTNDAEIASIWEGLHSAGRFDGRLRDRRADGTEFPAAISAIRLPPGPDGAAHFVCTLRDLSAEEALEERLAEAVREAEAARDTTITALAGLAEERERAAGRHLLRIEAYVAELAASVLEATPEALPRWARDARLVGRCAVLHDIGKVGVPDAVLLKPGRLDPEEQRVMRRHPRIGAEILDRALARQPTCAFLRISRDIVACHHEAHDGSGYPSGLFGDAIPLVAQLTSVADVFDALTSRRVYKSASDTHEAVRYLKEQSGRAFAPAAIDAFLDRLPRLLELHGQLGDPSDHAPIEARSIVGRDGPPLAPPPTTDEDVGSPVLAALGEALIGQRSGELIVRVGDELARIYVQDGRIAWAHVTSEPEVLTERLLREGLEAADLRAVVAECKTTGRNVGETIVEWGLVSREQLRTILRDHVARRVRVILAMKRPAVLFAPHARPYGSSLTFELRELLTSGDGA